MIENARGAVAPPPRFHVQVGAFLTPDDARPVVKRLESLGYAAALAGHEGYEVWVGGYLDRDTAERLAADVRRAGFNAVLVP
ncbi:MAG TPA: SPOR domain-containing protein [bacterium]|nr:SPOR domain-containing protein [bacterium]